MTTAPKKHHFLPQSILRNFSIDGKRRSVFVLDKTSLKSFASPIVDAGAERNFYCVDLDSGRLNFEPFFQELDDRLASLVAKITGTHTLTTISPVERYDLAVVTACQLLRTKLQRTSPVEFARQLAQRLREQGFEAPADLSDGHSRLAFFRSLLKLEPIARSLASKDLLLILSPMANLWTSDNPVVLHNSLPAGRVGLAAPGVEAYYPLAPSLCLSFLCPGIREIFTESLDPHHPRPAPRDPLTPQALRSLQEGTPLKVDDRGTDFLNSLQVAHSSRFLYSCKDDFKLARRAVNEDQELREVRSLASVGRLGSAPPPDPRMPSGTWLVIESGHRHHLLPVELVDEGSWAFAFTTEDLAKLAIIELNAPFDSVTLYDDRQPSQMLRNVEFRHVERDGGSFIRVQHADASLNALMEQIQGK